jgi:hypothetical protein
MNEVILNSILKSFHIFFVVIIASSAILSVFFSRFENEIISDFKKIFRICLVAAVASGLMMFFRNNEDYLKNNYFLLKMFLFVISSVLTELSFVFTGKPQFKSYIRFVLILNIILWISILFLGRWVEVTL